MHMMVPQFAVNSLWSDLPISSTSEDVSNVAQKKKTSRQFSRTETEEKILELFGESEEKLHYKA